MARYVRKSIVTLFAGVAIVTGVATPASAQPNQQDGLVNVNIQNVEIIEDVNIGVAAQIAANACDLVNVGQVAVLARAVDRSGDSETVCTTEQGDVILEQNT
jgi:hypothetical protein